VIITTNGANDAADVSEVHAAFSFKVEACKVSEFLCILLFLVLKKGPIHTQNLIYFTYFYPIYGGKGCLRNICNTAHIHIALSFRYLINVNS
jgi:hypothetical protein